MLFEVEWLHQSDVAMAWLECLAGFLEQERALRKLAGKSVPGMPKPARGFVREMPVFWGDAATGPDEPPESWEAAVALLVAEVRKTGRAPLDDAAGVRGRLQGSVDGSRCGGQPS